MLRIRLQIQRVFATAKNELIFRKQYDKTVFAFRLAYIIEIERAIGVKLPIILDSPSGKEVDQGNITLMMGILKRDFSDHQIIIASIFEYDFDPLNVIEIVNRLIEIE